VTPQGVPGTRAEPEPQLIQPAPAQPAPAPSSSDDTTTPAELVTYTWQITPDQANQVDYLVRRVRRQLGVRRLDRSAILFALVDIASRQDVHTILLTHLRSRLDSQTP